MRSRFAILTVAAMLAALLPATARADAESDFLRNERFQQLNSKNRLDEIPALDDDHPSRPMTDVLSLSTSNGQLVLRTKLPDIPVDQPRKLKLDSDPDWSIVNVTAGATGSDPVIPVAFALNRTRFDSQQISTLGVQEMKGSYLILTQRTQSVNGLKLVQLQMQIHIGAPNNPGLCQLLTLDQVKFQPTAPVTWQSANFSAFLREHPAETDRYVRPLLHQFGQDAALAPDPMLTFEVFSDQWNPDAATTAKITGLVADLGAPDFHTRTHAEHELAGLGKDAAVVLMRLDRTKLNAEQNARIDKLLVPYLPVPAKDAAALRSDPIFLLNCLYGDDPIIRKVAFAQLESATKLKLNFDPSADQATRFAAIPAMLKQLIDAKVIVETP